MDLLQRMNEVVEHIENNLTNEIGIDSLSRISGCSTHVFSHIFSFMAGMSVSEYIRRRRLSQAVFDIQNGNESLVDISLKYCYESQASFTRAFKELHGQTPAMARRSGVSMKTYPKITFKLIIKGVTEMDFRIVNKDSFKIIGEKSAGGWDDWMRYIERFDSKIESYYKAPLWQVGAYKNIPTSSFYHGEDKDIPKEVNCIVGAEYNCEPLIDGLEIEEFPDATWAVFDVEYDPENDATGKAYARIISEWFPTSSYKRNENLPHLEVFGIDKQPKNEVWVPVIKK